MAKKKRRDYSKCIAYNNMLKGEDYKCGLGFDVVEAVEKRNGHLKVVAYPDENACDTVKQPFTKEEFVNIAETLGIKWDIGEVVNQDDLRWF